MLLVFSVSLILIPCECFLWQKSECWLLHGVHVCLWGHSKVSEGRELLTKECCWDLPTWWPGGKTTEDWLLSVVFSVKTPTSLPYQAVGMQASPHLTPMSCFYLWENWWIHTKPRRKTLIITSPVFLESLQWCFQSLFHLALWKGDLILKKERKATDLS